MFKLFTIGSLFALALMPIHAFSANDCALLNQYSSTRVSDNSITLELTYLVDFDSDKGAQACLKNFSSDFERACENLNDGNTREKKILITLQNQQAGWESTKVVSHGRCKKSDTDILVDGQFQRKLKFELTGRPTIERPLQ